VSPSPPFTKREKKRSHLLTPSQDAELLPVSSVMLSAPYHTGEAVVVDVMVVVVVLANSAFRSVTALEQYGLA
jgi:hypothetical protein